MNLSCLQVTNLCEGLSERSLAASTQNGYLAEVRTMIKLMMESPRAFVKPFILDENNVPLLDHIILNEKHVTLAKLQLPISADNVWMFVNRSNVD